MDETVLMQELQRYADLGGVKSGTCISIEETMACNLVEALLTASC